MATNASESGEESDAVDHVQRIEDALAEINHLEYVDVSEGVLGDVCVRVADHMENALVNNGEWAKFHEAGYVGHHVDFEDQEIELRAMDGGSE